MVKLNAKEFGQLAVCAERYAVGRHTYIVDDVCRLIKRNRTELSNKDIQVMLNDLTHPLFGIKKSENSIDTQSWIELIEDLKSEQEKRQKRVITERENDI